MARRLMTVPGINQVGPVNKFAAHAFHGLRTAMTQEQLRTLCAETGWSVESLRTTAPRLLRFGNTHGLSGGLAGRVWRYLDQADRLIDERSWIQIAASKT